MILLRDVKCPPDTDFSHLTRLAAQVSGLPAHRIRACRLLKRSVDARKKPEVTWVCTLALETDDPARDFQKIRYKNKELAAPTAPAAWPAGVWHAPLPPVVVGSGPAGLFAALTLARAGGRPVLIERGQPVEQRIQTVTRFWKEGTFSPAGNVQFGEGGAGTFSDGKLNTGIKDPLCRLVLETFVRHGAPESILYDAKPHVGTDRLVEVVRSLRREIESLGGQVWFEHQLTDLTVENGRLTGLLLQTPAGPRELPCRQAALALGHSARDTLRRLYDRGVAMEQKPFSMGVRIEHPQDMVNISQYGTKYGAPPLPTADYKLSVHLPDGRGVYTFCMCPGGQVVAASSQAGGVCTNGMSYHARSGQNANSGLLVGVQPEDFGSNHPLAGVWLQEKTERAAFEAAGGHYFAPVQLAGDFLRDQASAALGAVQPTYQPGVAFCRLEAYLPDFVTRSLRAALPLLGQKLKGFDRPDAVLCGPETRSSSPVRLPRDESGQANVKGLYPCGEGAGYAGGITSAAVDGIRTAQRMLAGQAAGAD